MPDGEPVKHTPLVGASAMHVVSESFSGSHLGSTLQPGRAVLTRGVSRRSGSVAYIRADASPSEMLARTWWQHKPGPVKPPALTYQQGPRSPRRPRPRVTSGKVGHERLI